MRIRELVIHNFRSIKDLKIEAEHLVVLVGPNNAGKSNVLGALDFALTAAVKPASEELFAYRDEGDDGLWVEVEFSQLTEQEVTTFREYVGESGLLRIRRTATFPNGAKPDYSYNGYRTEPKLWWLKSSAWARLSSRELARSEAESEPALKPLGEASGRISKPEVEEFQKEVIKSRSDLEWETQLEAGPLLGRETVASGILPEFFLVPAVRELADETKAKGTAPFGRLLQRSIGDVARRTATMESVETQLRAAVDQLNARPDKGAAQPKGSVGALEADLEAELAFWGVSVSITVDAPPLERIFELGTRILIDDGHETDADRKGHGLQRALIFALLRIWATATRAAEVGVAGATVARRASTSAVFAVEEPELFLHPHAQRQLHGVLRTLAETDERQVFICTHSPAFVEIESYKGMTVICKENPRIGTVARQCRTELFGVGDAAEKARFHMAGWINPDRGEIFFARKAVFVEGETELRVLPMLGARLGCRIDDVSVVDCGGKNNLISYMRLANGFGIPYAVVHDEDPLPEPVPTDWREDKVKHKRSTFEENSRIDGALDRSLGQVHVLRPCFEDVAGVSRTQGDKVGKAMAAVTYFATAEVPPQLKAVVEAVFGTSDNAALADVPTVPAAAEDRMNPSPTEPAVSAK